MLAWHIARIDPDYCISWFAGSILCHAWNFKVWGSSTNSTASAFTDGWGLFTTWPHCNSSDIGDESLQGWWRDEWGEWLVWVSPSNPFSFRLLLRSLYNFGLLQLSFQEWTQQMRDMLEARKRGDYAFRDKDFKTAIDCYSQVQL